MTSSIADKENILTYPNRWLALMEFMQDPARLQQYLSSNCETQTVKVSSDSADDYTVSRFLANQTITDSLPEGSELRICKDTFGAWEAYNQCVSLELV